MDYETVVMVSQIAGLLIFVGLFAVVLVYALWPGNKKRFEQASRLPLDQDDSPQEESQRGDDGR
jgi:cytochrome c oxidase cbb3-type subunit IV